MSILSISFLIVIGIILFLIEFLVIPGISVAGIAGFIAITGGIFCGYYFYDAVTGTIILLVSVFIMAIMFYLAFKYKTWQNLSLTAMVDGKTGVLEENSVQIGDEGVTVSKLSPIGNALINNKIFEVRSEGEYVNSNIKVQIKHIDGNKIYIETIK